MISINQIKTYLLDLQERICRSLEEEEETGKFVEDQWQYQAGEGGGLARVLEEGKVIEKAGANFSHVIGLQLPGSVLQQRPELSGRKFQAMGVSVIVHPRNPYAPTSHFNIRFFLAEKAGESPIWWFGGGFDLTPYYGFVEDCVFWHQMAHKACEPFGENLYSQFKKACDDYFFLKHRDEPRGIGGLFFDYFNTGNFTDAFALARSIAEHYILAYQPILRRRKHTAYGQRERDFQNYRRGRYVEFNLLYDRGTLFGLQSQGRTESILVSLPPQVTWRYNWRPAVNTPEDELYKKYLVVQDWLNYVEA